MFAQNFSPPKQSRWYIHRSEGRIKIGPLYASQIREGLREGIIDPFDLVSREGEREYKKIIEEENLFRTIQNLESDSSFDLSSHDKNNLKESNFQSENGQAKHMTGSLHQSHLKVLASSSLNSVEPTLKEKESANFYKHVNQSKNHDRNHLSHPFAPTDELPRLYYLRTPTGIKSRKCSISEICEFFHSQDYCSDCTVHRKGINGNIRLGTFMQLISGTRRTGQSPVQAVNYLIRMKKNHKINTESIGILIDTYTNPYHTNSKISLKWILPLSGLLMISGVIVFYSLIRTG